MYVPRMALLLSSGLCLACAGEEPGGIESTIARATLEVRGAADGLAMLDVTVDLQARGQPEEVSLVEAFIVEQPVSDASNTLVFEAQMMNPQGDDPVVRMARGEAISARVINVGTTNAQLDEWCGRPAELSLTVGTADGEESTATANLTVRCE